MPIPPDVLRAGRAIARSLGLDPEDGESLAAEHWWAHPDHWRLATKRDCIDLLRHQRGDTGHGNPEHPPPIPVDPQPAEGLSPLDGGADDPALEAVEVRCLLADRLAALPDADLAALARVYWLGLPFPGRGAAYVDTMRGLRRARRA